MSKLKELELTSVVETLLPKLRETITDEGYSVASSVIIRTLSDFPDIVHGSNANEVASDISTDPHKAKNAVEKISEGLIAGFGERNSYLEIFLYRALQEALNNQGEKAAVLELVDDADKKKFAETIAEKILTSRTLVIGIKKIFEG